MTHNKNEPLTEELQCSDEFAAMLLEAENGPWIEIDGDELVAELDRMIAVAEAADGKATQ